MLRSAVWTLSCLLPLACGGDRPAPTEPAPATPKGSPRPDEILASIDGIDIRFSDLAVPLAFLDALAPEYALRKKVQRALPDFTIPLLFARREFAAQRAEQLELATTVRAAVGNVDELLAAAKDRDHRRAPVSPGDPAFPVAQFLFDPTRVGAVSEPIEVPEGYVLAGSFGIDLARTGTEDLCDSLQVAFYTHPANVWREWVADLRERIKDKVTYVHPDFRASMPGWLVLP